MLLVRLCGDTVPKSWNRWGRPLSRESHRIWAFPLPEMMDLADLVEALAVETPPEFLSDCLAVWINPDFDGRLPLSVLDELESLSVLHTRLHEPWIMGELGHLLTPCFQAIVQLGILANYSATRCPAGSNTRIVARSPRRISTASPVMRGVWRLSNRHARSVRWSESRNRCRRACRPSSASSRTPFCGRICTATLPIPAWNVSVSIRRTS